MDSKPAGFLGQAPYGPTYFWGMLQRLWAEAEFITAEAVLVTADEAAQLRSWING